MDIGFYSHFQQSRLLTSKLDLRKLEDDRLLLEPIRYLTNAFFRRSYLGLELREREVFLKKRSLSSVPGLGNWGLVFSEPILIPRSKVLRPSPRPRSSLAARESETETENSIASDPELLAGMFWQNVDFSVAFAAHRSFFLLYFCDSFQEQILLSPGHNGSPESDPEDSVPEDVLEDTSL